MAGLRSSFRPLLFVFVLAVVFISFRDYRKSSLNHWYDHAKSLVETSQPGHHEAHHVRQDGVLEVNMAGRHPFLDLMEDAERRFQQRQARCVLAHSAILHLTRIQDKARRSPRLSMSTRDGTDMHHLQVSISGESRQ